MASVAITESVLGFSPYALSLRSALKDNEGRSIATFDLTELSVEIRAMRDSLWALVRRKGHGGLALRAAFMAGAFTWTKLEPAAGEALKLRIESAMGSHVVVFASPRDTFERLRVTVRFTPAVPLVIPFMPRDLYPLDARDDPLGASGNVEAGQRGLNVGIVYFQVSEPAFGNVLYLQNFTALNDYFAATRTKPEGAVGGIWPELGYLPPSPSDLGKPCEPLQPGVEVTLSDAILVVRNDLPADERDSARHFLQMLGAAYLMIDHPETEYHDWIERAERTADDLERAPEATIRHYGHRYVHPYTAAEYPDIMVQMAVIAALHDWGKWRGEPLRLEAELKTGLEKFYDPKLKTLRRYLPNVGPDKNADAVDSWYLYHPLLNLGLLALDGDERCRDLFLKSLDYGIKAAHHFSYQWPIQYDITDFTVITKCAPADGRGQTDVGGVYAWVMLQAFELTDDKRFLDEARAAIDATMGLRFNVNYQANLTAWGAAACMRLWRITSQDLYLQQSYVLVASFLHNCVIWESRIALAAKYHNFFAVTCLQDAPYIAMYECFESFAAFERYLDDSGPELEPAARMLLSEFCKYGLTRAWYFYPDALPPEAISPKQRDTNGHVDRKLSFPLEDVYVDGQQAGQVGQEVYGAGGSFVFATRAFHTIDGAPFRVYCDHFVRACEQIGEHGLTITINGGETCTADLSLVRLKRRKLPKITVATTAGAIIRPYRTSADRIDYRVPAVGRLVFTWE
ncbi:MAG: hypothetical protein JF593_13080 [Novosphingobium sp.]|nr:hypothetical protein [Novosphingobium sp.]